MTAEAGHLERTGAGLCLAPWSNVVLQPDDKGIQWIHRLEQRAQPIPPPAWAIRELITRLAICHFKVERHIGRILEAIRSLSLDFVPASIGSTHPKSGEQAWLKDKTGRSRQGQEFIWALRLWLLDTPCATDDPRAIPPSLIANVQLALGPGDANKRLLVAALVNRLVLKSDREPLPAELTEFWVQVEATDICHYTFPANLERMIESIGNLEPARSFVGCGSCDDARSEMARVHVSAICSWLRGERDTLEIQLGERSPVRMWLAASLAKTLKELAGLPGPLPNEVLGA